VSDELNAQEITEALKIAGELIDAGFPIFAAPPCPPDCPIERHTGAPGEYHLPNKWQLTYPSRSAHLEKWRPGWALGMLGGKKADILDTDPRNGGRESEKELIVLGQMPRSFGEQDTPSGGTHRIISLTGERKSTGFMPGMDLQSGDADGRGIGFVYISPTIRPSKAPETLGQLRPYRWKTAPDIALLEDFAGSDDSTEYLIDRVRAYRSSASSSKAATPLSDLESRIFGGGGSAYSDEHTFTPEEARTFVEPALAALRSAEIGVIEERCNAAAVLLSRFVPNFLTVDGAMGLLEEALKHTAYDPSGPSNWTVEKFEAVLDGRRPIYDPWKAEKRPDFVPPVIPPEVAAGGSESRTDWLERQLVTAEELAALPPPEPLVYGLLNLNTESWMIGAPGSYKSFVALDIAGHVGAGRVWQDHKVRRGDVIYLAAEGVGGMTLRTRAWQKEYGTMAGVSFLPLPVQVSRTDDWAALVEMCRRRKPSFIVIDTQHRVTKGLEENSAKEMGIFTDAISALRTATGACVLVIHHTGRNGGDARGSSALDGAQDTELKLERLAPRSSMKVRLKEDKQKDMAEDEGGQEITLKVVGIGQDPNTGEGLSSLVLLAADAFRDAASKVEAPEEWEMGHGPAQVQIIKVLRDQGGQVGLTKAEARAAVVERFYGGKTKALARSSFYSAWTKVLEKVDSEGGQVVSQMGGSSRFVVDSVALESMEPSEK
jgi:hypothetical protein